MLSILSTSTGCFLAADLPSGSDSPVSGQVSSAADSPLLLPARPRRLRVDVVTAAAGEGQSAGEQRGRQGREGTRGSHGKTPILY